MVCAVLKMLFELTLARIALISGSVVIAPLLGAKPTRKIALASTRTPWISDRFISEISFADRNRGVNRCRSSLLAGLRVVRAEGFSRRRFGIMLRYKRAVN